MTLFNRVETTSVAGVAISPTPAGLHTIHETGCAAAIWQRQPLDRFQAWIDGLPTHLLPKARVILKPAMVRQAMVDLCDTTKLPQSTERTMLVDDIAAMADIFTDVMQAPYVRLRLDVISTNACRKFHIDALTARLICTYRGSGTQYGASRDGDAPTDIFAVPTGSAMIMRGTSWPTTPKSQMLHRSPPIEGTGETRLVLVLDPMANIESEPDTQLIH